MCLLVTVVSQLSLCPECPPPMILPEECPQVVQTGKKKANIQRGADCNWNWMLFQAWRSTTELTWCALYLLPVCGLEGWCEHRLPKESLIRVSIALGWVSQRTRAPEKNTLWDAELPPLQCLASGQQDSCQSQSSQRTAWMKASPLDPDKICGKSLETL